MILKQCDECINECKEMEEDNPIETLMWENGKCPEFKKRE